MRTALFASLVLGTLACQSAPSSRARFDDANVFRFHYVASAEPGHEAGPVDLWIPIPVDLPEQRIDDLEIEASHPYTIRDIENGRGRALHTRSETGPVRVHASYTVRRLAAEPVKEAEPEELVSARGPDRMVPLDGKVAAMAVNFAGTSPENLGRELYLHTLERMRYEKPETGGWGRGDAEWACDSRLGNCTDFHSYFIGLARANGVPARFEMGFPVPRLSESDGSGDSSGERAEVKGYHCWAWFWSANEGWVPVDISEADKHPELADFYFGALDDSRVTLTEGRDLVLDPRPAAGPLNFFVYPHVEAGGRELMSGVTKQFWVTRP